MKLYRPIAILAWTVVMLCAAWPAAAQPTTSPYSMYGYGILSDRATSMQRQMGGIGYAMNGGRQINAMNPASYSQIDSLTFLWDMGANISWTWRREGKNREKVTGGGLDYITMQFPISKFLGGSLGLLPYSSVGYAFGDEVRHGAVENQGSGGINQAYLGLSGKMGGFSIGANVSYDFGNIQNDIYTVPSNSGNTLFEQIMQVRDWSVVIGAQYTQKIGQFSTATIGITYTPAKSLHGQTWATVQEMTQESASDTVAYSKLKGKYTTPTCIGAGISWKRTKNSSIYIGADFSWQQWSKAKYSPLYSEKNPGIVAMQGLRFNDRIRLAAGAEYVPQIFGNYLQRTAYRIGAFACRDYLTVDGNSVREYGITCGFGLHTPQEKTMVNIGVEWRHRSAHPARLVSENYLSVTLGLNFNELWFWQRKIR